MAERNALIQSTACTAPEIGELLTAYCFGRAAEAERQLVEVHLPKCERCRQEADKLSAAVRVLAADQNLLQTLTPADIAATFGLSGKLDAPFGGHLWHALASCGIYAAIYAVALVVEVAYQFDRYGSQGVTGSLVVFGWVWATSLAGLALDWKLTRAGDRRAWLAAAGVFGLGALGAVLLSRWFLPAEPITLLTTAQAAPAQAAYLKAVLYGLILNALFLLPPFHFVVAMQRELTEGRHRMTLGLLTGDKRSVTPRGTLFPRLPALVVCFLLVIIVALYLHHSLMNQLRPDRYLNLFSGLIYARLFLYFALATEGLVWYARSLNELKRECLAAERAWFGR